MNSSSATAAPLVSVILPTYNRSATLGRAIASVLTQEINDLELLVVDDASTDGTVQVVRQYDDARIHYLKLTKNSGAHVARNIGIARSRGRYIAFQDSDDESFPKKLGSLVEALQRCPTARAAFIRGCSLRPSGRCRLIPDRSLVSDTACDGFLGLLLEGSMISTPLLLVERKLLNEVGGFDESRTHLMEDWDLCIRLALRTRFAFVGDVGYRAYSSADSISVVGRAEERAAIESVMLKHEGEFVRHPRALAIQFFRLFFYALAEWDFAGAARYLWDWKRHPGASTSAALRGSWRLACKFTGKLIERMRRPGANWS